MRTIRSVGRIINLQTLVVTVLAVASMYVCGRLGLTADFPLTMVSIAVVFPLVFSINGAYKRREVALDQYGSIKAHGRAIFFAARDWPPETDSTTQRRILDLLGELMLRCRTLFQAPPERVDYEERRVYESFSHISGFVKELRGKGLPSGEASRCNQYLSKMMIAFERTKHIYQYRTPRALRAYSTVFIYVIPILYGPYFADIANGIARPLQFFMPVLFSVVLVSLENIQEELENPFDQVGEDDVMINAEKFVERLESVSDLAPAGD